MCVEKTAVIWEEDVIVMPSCCSLAPQDTALVGQGGRDKRQWCDQDIDAPGPGGVTKLMWLLKNNRPESSKLIEAKANLDIKTILAKQPFIILPQVHTLCV